MARWLSITAADRIGRVLQLAKRTFYPRRTALLHRPKRARNAYLYKYAVSPYQYMGKKVNLDQV